MSNLHSFFPRFHESTRALAMPVVLMTALIAAGCSGNDESHPRESARVDGPVAMSDTAGVLLTITDTTFSGSFGAAGVAAPLEEATLSTTLMGTVTDVLVHEGDRVHTGQVLLRIDAGELAARAQRLSASVADADAMHRDAEVQARRFAALYADSAATRAQYEAAQTGLARAEAGVRAARAAAAELDAASRYSTLRAPFDGVVIRRAIDRGGMATPGAPLLTVQNATTLRISAAAPITVTRRLHRGQRVDVIIGDVSATATIEGVVPAGSSNLFTVNALVQNRDAHYAAGSSATILLPTDSVRGIMIPVRALLRDGDLVGVLVDRGGMRERRWIRVGGTFGDRVEVTSGLHAGDRVVMPHDPTGRTAASAKAPANTSANAPVNADTGADTDVNTKHNPNGGV
ncbi:efflux RND transporter periplasmic adaptor subunit [Gemmatimonas aurantiaca]|uniref:efflux RND transporter periplasmic adaptor subunit n=1 Tax=Gemmatimonas aurantiaca TaxID=173480 RepID=UPI00301BCA25